MKKKVLIIATSRKTRGGITAVVEAHEKGEQWRTFHCKWIQTHRDGGCFIRIIYFLKAFFLFVFCLPFYSIVHIHLSQTTSAIRKSFFFLLAWMCGKKIIIHFHAFSVESSILQMPGLYKFLFLHCDIVLVLSAYWKKALVQNIGIKNNVRVLYNPCPIVQSRKNKGTDIKYVLYAGTIGVRKGYIDLINAFAMIYHKYPDWRLILAGNGTVDEGVKIVQRLAIEHRVDFIGWVDGQAKEDVFLGASIFCLPSYAEGFPMAVLDAWAYGLPVITTPVGGIPDVARNGENMLLFDPGDVNGLAEQLERMIVDESLRNKIAAASNDLARTIFNINVINKQLECIYSSL